MESMLNSPLTFDINRIGYNTIVVYCMTKYIYNMISNNNNELYIYNN